MKTKMAMSVREHRHRLHSSNHVKGLAAMTIEAIENEMLTQDERDQLAKDTRRWKRMGEGAHLQEWLEFGPSFMILRRIAMRMAGVNRPEGRGYVQAMGQLMERHGLSGMDKTSITAVLWLHQPEHATILKEILDKLTPGQRARLNSPITARQRVERELKDRQGAGGAQDESPRDPNMPVEKINDLKKQVTRLAQEVAVANHTMEHLWEGLNSYCKDAPEGDVTDILLKTMKPEKVRAVCIAALKALGLTVKVSGSSKRKRYDDKWKQSGLSRREYQRRQKEEGAPA